MTYIQHPLHPAGYQQVQLTEFVSNITPPLNAMKVAILPENENIRFRDDSVDPTTTVGMEVVKETIYTLESDSTSLRLITETLTTAAEKGFVTLLSGPANSNVTITSVDTGPEWNDYDFAIVEDAAAAVNATATIDSGAVDSDLAFTANSPGDAWNDYTFTIALDAVNAANADATILSAGVNSDVTFTSAVANDTWNGYDFEIVIDASVGINATATLLSAPVNSDLTLTAAAIGLAWNDYDFEVILDANAGVYSTAVLLSAPVNSDVTFTAAALGTAWDGVDFDIVADAYAGARATAIINSAAVNSDLTLVALVEGVNWNNFTFETVLDSIAGVNSTANILSAAVNSDLTFTAAANGTDWDSWDFETVLDAVAGVNATAEILSAAVNSDLTFIAAANGVDWNDYNFESVADVTAGVNADATLDITAVNSDLVFTAPAVGVAYNDIVFVAVSNGAEDVTYDDVNTFTLEYNAATSNGTTMKAAFDAAVGACGAWPQFACAVEGDGTGTWEAGDDSANATSANGVDAIVLGVTFATNTFTIHFTAVTTTANDVAGYWAAGPANCANFAIAEEGDGTGVIDADTDTSAGGIDYVAPSIDFAANAFTIHMLPAATAGDVETLWNLGAPVNCTDWAIAPEGDGTGAVDANTGTSSGGGDYIADEVLFAPNAFTIHAYPAATAADIVLLWEGAGAPVNCADWAIGDEGDGSGAVDAKLAMSIGGVDPIIPFIVYAADVFTIHVLPVTTTANDVAALWIDVASPAECADWVAADEGDGTGRIEVVSDTSAGGVDVVAPYIDFVIDTFTIHVLPAATAGDVETLWNLGVPANCTDFAIAVEGDGTGAVDANTATSAGGLEILVPYIDFTDGDFTIHVYPAATAGDVVALWAGGPANCADWGIANEGDGTGAVDANTATSVNGVTQIDPYIDLAVNAFTIHMFPTQTAGDVATLWGLGAPVDCSDWLIAAEGAGTGVVDDAANDISIGGVTAIAPFIEYANADFTIHTIPAVTTSNDVAVLWLDVASPAECAEWDAIEEGDGTGVVAAATDTSANGADGVGAIVNLLWHKEV